MGLYIHTSETEWCQNRNIVISNAACTSICQGTNIAEHYRDSGNSVFCKVYVYRPVITPSLSASLYRFILYSPFSLLLYPPLKLILSFSLPVLPTLSFPSPSPPLPLPHIAPSPMSSSVLSLGGFDSTSRTPSILGELDVCNRHTQHMWYSQLQSISDEVFVITQINRSLTIHVHTTIISNCCISYVSQTNGGSQNSQYIHRNRVHTCMQSQQTLQVHTTTLSATSDCADSSSSESIWLSER